MRDHLIILLTLILDSLFFSLDGLPLEKVNEFFLTPKIILVHRYLFREIFINLQKPP
jgi:hypothetical protein